jgi:hypothetical protein
MPSCTSIAQKFCFRIGGVGEIREMGEMGRNPPLAPPRRGKEEKLWTMD